MLKFATEKEAIQYLADISGKKIKISATSDIEFVIEIYKNGNLKGTMEVDAFKKEMNCPSSASSHEAVKRFNEQRGAEGMEAKVKMNFIDKKTKKRF
jgi:hypothetical protein